MESKSELVYGGLRQRLVNGEFAPGHRLVLARLAEQYHVSVVPVREALRRLEAEGLLRYTRNVGAKVAEVDPAHYADTMQVLAFVEGAATALASPLLSDDELARARAINDEMRAARQQLEPVRFTELNHEFHRVLCGACPNDHLREVLEREWERMGQVRRSSFTYVPERSETSVEEHDRLLALIESGAPAADIEHAAREHKLCTMRQFLERQG